MARDYATLRTDLWGDSDWRALSVGAQWLYMYLLSVPSLTYVGVADWRPNRIAGVLEGQTAESIREFAGELQTRRFIWTDDDKEEVVIRSFLRHDGLLLNPNLWKSVKNDFADVASETIRRLIAHEANRLRSESPEGITTPKGKLVNPWASPHLETMLDTPCETPWGTPSHTPSDTPSPRGSHTPSGTGSPPAPAPTPSSKEDRAAKRGSRIPEDFTITESMRKWAAEEVPLVDIDKQLREFMDYWRGVPGQKGVKLDWVGTWRNAMRKQQGFAEKDQARPASNAWMARTEVPAWKRQ